MIFNDVLRLYHISPLHYDDGSELSEKDYVSLFNILSKYFLMKKYFKDDVLKNHLEDINKKIEFLQKNSLIAITEEEVMNILMDMDEKLVLN